MYKSLNTLKYVLITTFGGFVFGVDAANVSGTVSYVQSEFKLNDLQAGNVVAIAGLGAVLALLFTGTLCERFGRKKVLISISLAYTLSSIFAGLAPNYEVLLFGRFLGGLAFASLSVTSMYIGEIAPEDKRGKFVAFNQLSIVIGSLVAFLINYELILYLTSSETNTGLITEHTIWRWMLGVALIPNLLWLCGLFIVPESPRWLMQKGKISEAEVILNKIISPSQIKEKLIEIEKAILKDKGIKRDTFTQLKTMFSKRMALVTSIALIYALVQVFTGTNAVLFYAPKVFEQIGFNVNDSFLQTVLLGVLDIVFVTISIMFVEKLGRRFLTLLGLTIILLAHLSTWYGFHTAKYEITDRSINKIEHIAHVEKPDMAKLILLKGKIYKNNTEFKADLTKIFDKSTLPLVEGPIIENTISINKVFVLVGIFVFLAAFHLSLAPIMWVIFSEIFPNAIRSVAIPIAGLTTSLGSYVLQVMFPWQLTNLGIGNTFLSYAGFALVGLVIFFFILPETKGKSIEKIEQELIKN